MKKIMTVLLLTVFASVCVYGTTIYRDGQGRYAGQSSTFGNTTTYRDAKGKVVRTEVKNGNNTIYHDGRGCYAGQSSTFGNTTTYRDAKGRVSATKR